MSLTDPLNTLADVSTAFALRIETMSVEVRRRSTGLPRELHCCLSYVCVLKQPINAPASDGSVAEPDEIHVSHVLHFVQRIDKTEQSAAQRDQPLRSHLVLKREYPKQYSHVRESFECTLASKEDEREGDAEHAVQ